MFEVVTRKTTGLANCGHKVKKGEKYLIVLGSYIITNSSYCEQCGLELMKKVLKNMLEEIKELGVKKGVFLGGDEK